MAEWNGTGQSWTIIGGPASYIAAGGVGLVAEDPGRNAVYLYTGTPNAWTQIGDASVGHDQMYVNDEGIFAVTSNPTNATIEEWSDTGKAWIEIGTTFSNRLWVGGDEVYASHSDVSRDSLLAAAGHTLRSRYEHPGGT